jgi:hypothetical protein
MAQHPAIKIKIKHDDYHARHIGRIADQRQFFLTNPFVWAMGDNPGREFLALYIFDADGNFLEAQIDDLGERENKILPGNKLDISFAGSLVDARLSELGEFSFGDIEVAPFRVERFGIEFGLIPQPPEDEDDEWRVTAEPGDYMAFSRLMTALMILRRTIKNLIRLVLLSTFVMLTASTVYPCVCDIMSPRKTQRKAKAVFIGEVVEIGENDKKAAAKFKIERYWKGVKEQFLIVVGDPSSAGACGLPVEIGRKYLIYAFKTGDGELETSFCASRRLDRAAEDLAVIGKGKEFILKNS